MKNSAYKSISRKYNSSSDYKRSEQIFNNLIWVNIRDTAKYLRRSENAIRILISRGVLNKYKLGGRTYLKRSEIDTLLEESNLVLNELFF